jgi:hypothetical protein
MTRAFLRPRTSPDCSVNTGRRRGWPGLSGRREWPRPAHGRGRGADGGRGADAANYPDRQWMLDLAEYQVGRVLAEL